MSAAARVSPVGAGDLHVTVYGRVQGVGFRESMIMAAVELGVTGWVRNRYEGTVEAVLRGKPQACEALVQWSQQGPAAARVERVALRLATAEESGHVLHRFRCRETS
jgi:acylphosphatase